MSGEGACPICGKAVVASFRPFCSARCAEIDLHGWLSDRYAVPVAADEPEGDEESAEDAGQANGARL